MYPRSFQNHSNRFLSSNDEENNNNHFRRYNSLDRRNLNSRTSPLIRDASLYGGNKPKGLQNIGATCYMNATLQCFFHIKKLTKYLSENKYSYDGISVPHYSITSEYIKLVKELLYRNGEVDYAPYDFKDILGQKNPLFKGVAANDSKDLILFILEELSKDLAIKNNKSIYKRNSKEIEGFVNQMDEQATFKEAVKQFEKDKSIIKDIFYFMIKTETHCQNCNARLYNFQVMNFLIFPLQKTYEDSKNMSNTYMLNNIMNNMNNMNSINTMNNNMYGMVNNNMNMNMNMNHSAPNLGMNQINNNFNSRPLLNTMNIMTNQNMNMSYNMNSLPNYNNNMNNMNSYRNSLQNYNNIFNDQNLLPKTEPNYKSHNLNNIFTKNNLNSNKKFDEENIFRKQSKKNKENNNFNSFSNNAQNMFLGNNNSIGNNRNNFHFSNQRNNNFNNFFNPNGETPVRLLNGKGGYGPYGTIVQGRNVNKGPKITLDQCFESYLKPDFMTGDNKQYCNNCHILTNSIYSTFIYSSPHILILVLNYGKGILFNCDVMFDEYINIAKFIETKNTNVPTRYRLLGAIVHIGPSSMGGHFIAFCRGLENKEKWYKLNDSLVSESTFSEIKSVGIPYVLFYENVNIY